MVSEADDKLCNNCKVKISMTIQKIAALHGLSPATLRHYERLGLIEERHVTRLPNGYRDFSEEASRTITLIRLGQALGFSLRDMATKLRAWSDGTMAVAEKKSLLRHQLGRIEAKQRELEQLKSLLLDEIAKDCRD